MSSPGFALKTNGMFSLMVMSRAYRHNAGFFARAPSIDIITESAKWCVGCNICRTRSMKWWILAQWGQESTAKFLSLSLSGRVT